MSPAVLGIAACMIFVAGFAAGGVYVVALTLRKIERSADRATVLRALDLRL